MSKQQVFHPACFAMSKQEVVAMIQQRIKDELILPRWLIYYTEAQQVAALTDERMQQFVDAWGDAIFVGIDSDATMLQPLQQQEEILKRLANDLSDVLSNFVPST